MTFFCSMVRSMLCSIRSAASFQPRKSEHHHAREHHRAGIDDVFVGVFRRGAVSRFENGIAIADVGSGSDAQAADLRGTRVGDVVAVQVRT